MAVIRLRNTGERIEGNNNVKTFLNGIGVLYEHWDTEKLPAHLKDKFVLSDEEKEEVLAVYDEEIRSLAQRRGYQKWDVISLSEETPNLDELLQKFQQVHTHSEDEVRAIVAGEGVFTIKGPKDVGYFDAILDAGDVISVPEGTPHFFTLTDTRRVVAVRLFIDPSGWVAHPYDDPEFQP
ncbi:MAG: acireductone dioxygenase [Bacillaceae bacterium G1]|nr:acireductone dioxygenase [Bacillota bacterium]OJF18178.1 MAG: acireductone dioxygenase [Bacillaceae bacterium G1]